MKNVIKKVLLFNMIAMFILLSACGRLSDASKNTKILTEYKLINSMEVENTEAAREAIAAGADVNKFHRKECWHRVENGQFASNPVRIAMFNGCYQVAEILLESGADANYEDNRGISLLQAASNKNGQFIKTLLNYGADINKVCNNDKTALEFAISKCRWNSVKVLLSCNSQIREETVTALVDTRKNHPYDLWRGFDEIKALLDRPGFEDCEVRKLFSVTIPTDIAELHAVAAYGTPEMVAAGLQNVNYCDLSELCECAAHYGNTAVLKYIADTYSNWDAELSTKALCAAAETDDAETTGFILSLSANADLGKAAAKAAKNNSIKVMKKLIDSGLNINEPADGESLLKPACFEGDMEMVQFLVEQGADVNGIYNGEPLSAAAREGYVDIVQYLIDNGADVNGNNVFSDGSGGQSVLMYAIGSGQMECVKKLVENGADVHYEFTDYKNNHYSVIETAEKESSDRICEYIKQQAEIR